MKKLLCDIFYYILLPLFSIYLIMFISFSDKINFEKFFNGVEKNYARRKMAKLIYGKDWKAQIKECEEAHLNGDCPLCTPAQPEKGEQCEK